VSVIVTWYTNPLTIRSALLHRYKLGMFVHRRQREILPGGDLNLLGLAIMEWYRHYSTGWLRWAGRSFSLFLPP